MSLIFKFAFVDRAHVSVSFHGTLYRWHETFREVNVGYIGGIVQSRFHLERLCLSLSPPPFPQENEEHAKFVSAHICTTLFLLIYLGSRGDPNEVAKYFYAVTKDIVL